MSKTIDGIIKDWGERADYGRVKGRAVKNVRGGKGKPARPPSAPSQPKAGPATREKLARTVRKAPEVLVKISGGGKNMTRIKAHMDYISRHGAVELEDERGLIYSGKEDVRDMRDSWMKGGIPIPSEGERRREAYNIILSMPAGTDRASVTNAAREFAALEFQGHQFAFAQHDDEKHSHVHLVVKAAGFDGTRLNPRKADLQRWRETFAEQLRAQGIEANATPRKFRGVVQKADQQAFRQMETRKRKPQVARRKATWRADAEREARGEAKHVNPYRKEVYKARRSTEQLYGEMARELAKGNAEDRALALGIVGFVRDMPAFATKHQAMVAELTKSVPTLAAERTREAVQPQAEQGREQPKPRKPDRER